MKRSFYQWLMTQRNPNGHDELANFANNAFFDQAFPKQSEDYHEIAQYLELNGTYLPNMDVFDGAFREYQELNQL
ncbi:hypothetical protein FC83_GL002412 [Agrilactobacillus composti DSM 18527 = JCM 14202]|uniref:UPF0346 protein FC83_GL002412 n=1 Tax=Agrilactobacillus composti DSM 18527 = JCM 14202 TaxID=1423734 RepID=X0PNJ2_9LACO|nr:YozE family protein [Agrilactobacillus composti]KRM36540.1 hypothetical protein FC83_GL002412 [Agrilactobacillus composti DSM 18527 = JCM 14202]GAF39147.1 hypothetical protein JCM14202_990 [Agrilactobacillus composti DSM 18527 = JCM 14202]